MSMYPTLSDLRVDQTLKLENNTSLPYHELNSKTILDSKQSLYPTINDYKNFDLTTEEINIITKNDEKKEEITYFDKKNIFDCLSINSNERKPANKSDSIHEVVINKQDNDKFGLRLIKMNNGVFVNFVLENSPAAISGLRYGDQILKINDKFISDLNESKLNKLISKETGNIINLMVRDRPFEQKITLFKDNKGKSGFAFKDGKITHIMKDSSAAHSGLLTNHYILEINGQNVIGLPDKKITKIINQSDNCLTLTIAPFFF